MLLPQLALCINPPTYTSHINGMTGTCHHAQFIARDGVSLTFFAQASLKLLSSLSLPPEKLVFIGVTPSFQDSKT
jgi:hypothetical protein